MSLDDRKLQELQARVEQGGGAKYHEKNLEQGKIFARKRIELLIDEGAEIQGNVEAAVVTISGQITGDVSSRGGIVVRASAKVSGNLGSPEVTLDEGAEFSGRIDADFELPAELLGGLSGAR